VMSVVPGQKIDPVAKTIAPPAETAP
jgi:hypothetical protein